MLSYLFASKFNFVCILPFSSIFGSFQSTEHCLLSKIVFVVDHENLTNYGNPNTGSNWSTNHCLDNTSPGYPHPKLWFNFSLESANSTNSQFSNKLSLETFAIILAAETTGYLSSAFDSDTSSVSGSSKFPQSLFISLICLEGGPS